MMLRPIAAALAGLLAAGLAQAAAPPSAGPDAYSPRGQRVYEIVAKWAPHVQERYGVAPQDWVADMASTFAGAELSALEAAALATDFDTMNQRLLATAPDPLAMNQALAAGPSPDALGDAANDLVYVPVTPCRLLDTRIAGGAIAANSVRDFDITSVGNYTAQGGSATDCGIGSAGDFAAAVINFTVVTPGTAGYMTAYPHLGAQPLAATLNYSASQTRGNLAIVRLDQSPAVPEMSVYTFAQTHLVADVMGYFTNPAATALNCVSSTLDSFDIGANTNNFFNNAACPAGYTTTVPYCWTAAAGVFSQGSGHNANAPNNPSFCAWQNTTGASQTVFGGNVCCRVPGR